MEDYRLPGGWVGREHVASRSRGYCDLLEKGQIVFFPSLPFHFPIEDQEFLLAQQWTELRLHKNVSYRPSEDVLRGVSGDARTIERIHAIMRNYSAQVIEFLTKFLAPYATRWNLDFSSFRPIEEEGRDLPIHKRNDLLHVDAFPSRPTRGGRILRVFTNLNPKRPRVWNTTEGFESLARQFAKDAGLGQIAEGDTVISRTVQTWGEKLGFRGHGQNALRHVYAAFSRLLERELKIPGRLPEIPAGISASRHMARFYGLRGTRSNLRPVRHRTDPPDSSASAGRSERSTLPDSRESGWTPARNITKSSGLLASGFPKLRVDLVLVSDY